jgi:hypothetical protein
MTTAECAKFDPWGDPFTGQGEPGNGIGEDFRLPAMGQPLGRTEEFTGGTLIGIGGHVHPGGLTNEIDLVRNGQSKRIYTGQATYWDHDDPSQTGGPPTSWDFSMKVTGLPKWGVRVEPGDVLRSNATYDTAIASTYENMGIAIALLAPDGTAIRRRPASPAAARRTDNCESGGLSAHADALRPGQVTHGHYRRRDHSGRPARNAPRGRRRRNQDRNFLTRRATSTVSMTGVPAVSADTITPT